MLRHVLSGLWICAATIAAAIPVALAVAPSPVKADVGPPPPQPPPPAGASKAVIRGVSVQQVYTYWRGRRWMTVIDGCAASQAACAGNEVSRCFVVEIDGRAIEGGNIALLISAEKSAGAAPIKLTLDNCKLKEIVLKS